MEINGLLMDLKDNVVTCVTEVPKGDVYKRQHLQDATPIEFSQEISGWRGMLEKCRDMIVLSMDGLKELALGGTACLLYTSVSGTAYRTGKDFGGIIDQHWGCPDNCRTETVQNVLERYG